jgi:UDP-GlcNAc3NAcA epimerase
MKILTVVGARPQFIKTAMVARALRARGLNEVLVHTGQHYDVGMSQVFFEEFEIPAPNYNLEVGSGMHGEQTGRMLEGLEKVILNERPDWVVVHGDTNSTLAGTLAAAKLQVPVAHVEAGLRSFNRAMPEEINRLVADQLATLLFTPTDTAVQNLVHEGICGERVREVGDVMYDAVLHFGERAQNESAVLERLQLKEKGYLLATIHRAENTDCPECLRAISEALEAVNRELSVVWPMHPRTNKALAEQELDPEVQIIDPVGYLDMQRLEQSAAVILTDSGGIQKEACFHRVPCVTVREETEWVELVEGGWNRLAKPSDSYAIQQAVIQAQASTLPRNSDLPYGDGFAAEKIVDHLCAHG